MEGSERYAAKVDTDDDDLPDSICTCPYGFDCKHGVAVVLEYLERVETNRRVPKAGKDDERLVLLTDENCDDGADIATAVQAHAPDRAVAIWKDKTEQLIAQVKPQAYQEVAKYLRKAGSLMTRQKKRSSGSNT